MPIPTKILEPEYNGLWNVRSKIQTPELIVPDEFLISPLPTVYAPVRIDGDIIGNGMQYEDAALPLGVAYGHEK